MVYNYIITTSLNKKINGLMQVIKDVSITPGEALKLYLRHHEKLRGETIIKKRDSASWQIIELTDLKKEVEAKVKAKGKRGAYKINI